MAKDNKASQAAKEVAGDQEDTLRALHEAEGRLVKMEQLRDDLAMRLDTAMEALDNYIQHEEAAKKTNG